MSLRERLRDLVKNWKTSTVGIGKYGAMRPLTLPEKDVARACAEELESVLDSEEAKK